MVGLLRRTLPLLAPGGRRRVGRSAPACPFCTMQGQTLTGEVNQASWSCTAP